jgi:hypothetical protein
MPTQDQTQPGQPTDPAPQSTPAVPPPSPERTFTQADLDRIITARVAPLQQKASEYDKLLDAQKTDAQRQADAIARLEAENAEYKAAEARRAAALAARLPAEFVALVTGTTPEEITESVKQVTTAYTAATKPRPPQPDPHLGRGPSPQVEMTSVAQARERFSQRFKRKD